MMRIEAYGVQLELSSGCLELLESIRRDFSFFVKGNATGTADIHIQAELAPPPWDSTPDARCVMIQPHCVVYDHAGERWVDYQGRGLGRWRVAEDRAELWSEDFDLLYEITYLIILSRLGERHDTLGLHRVHALGLAVAGQGILCLLPSGGGKTTLGLGAMRLPGVSLLSDDHPLLDTRGYLRAFPNRLGLVGPAPADIDPRYVRQFSRRDHGDKTLVDVEVFGERVGGEVPLGGILLGSRRLSGGASITPLARVGVVPELLRSVVVGVGLPQVVEYFLRFDVADYVHKAYLVASRTRACVRGLAHSRVLRFELGRDRGENLRVFQDFLLSLTAAP